MLSAFGLAASLVCLVDLIDIPHLNEVIEAAKLITKVETELSTLQPILHGLHSTLHDDFNSEISFSDYAATHIEPVPGDSFGAASALDSYHHPLLPNFDDCPEKFIDPRNIYNHSTTPHDFTCQDLDVLSEQRLCLTIQDYRACSTPTFSLPDKDSSPELVRLPSVSPQTGSSTTNIENSAHLSNPNQWDIARDTLLDLGPALSAPADASSSSSLLPIPAIPVLTSSVGTIKPTIFPCNYCDRVFEANWERKWVRLQANSRGSC